MEYEYSFKVSNIDEYINYCKKNNYVFEKSNRQIRTIYRNSNGTIGRITEDIIGEEVTIKLDFKEDKIGESDLVVRKESSEIIVNDKEKCEDILNFLNYKKDNILDRTRTVYTLSDVKFEFDEYLKPSKFYVVAIEGKKEPVDNVYKELEDLNNKYKINN